MTGEVSPAAIAAAYPVSSVKKVESKRRKSRLAAGVLWDDILKESMDTTDTDTPVLVNSEEDKRHIQPEARRPAGRQSVSAQEPEDMIDEIRRIADGDPEKLMESHSYIFTEPVRPGKWVDSQG